MAQEFQWTAKREQAAQFVADDNLTDDEICAKVGVSNRQLDRWKAIPEFKVRVREHVAAWKARIMERGIAIKERRIAKYIDDFEATERILRERGAVMAQAAGTDPAAVECGVNYAGGASTGFITRDFRGKNGDRAIYQFDAALFRERLKIREQLAKELGQWVEKQAATDPDGNAATSFTLAQILTLEELSAIERRLKEKRDGPEPSMGI